MKNFIFPILIITTLIVISGFDKFSDNSNPRDLSYKFIDANNIRTQIRNNGSFDRDVNTMNAGFEWPKFSSKTAVYVSGLWLSCKVNDSIRVSISEYNSEFSAGYFDFSTQTPMGRYDPLFRIYKVSPDYPNGNTEFDPWLTWPVNQGAPWVDNNNNGNYEPPGDYPLMKGDQNFFYSCTDGYTDSVGFISSSAPSLIAEIHLYAWAKTIVSCADAVHYEWTIINKNLSPWTDMSAAVFSDIDIGNSINDKVGTDSSLNMIFGYNGAVSDPVYGLTPPAIGIVVKNASGHSSNKSDFASRWRCPFDCPINSNERFNVLHGFRANGTNWINPITNTVTKYPFSGDVVAQTGWLDSTQGERYMIIGSEFGNVASLDTIKFETVSFIKSGSNNLTAVGDLKNCVNSVIGIGSNVQNLPKKYELYQNYPNPFNPVTKINYELQITNYNFVSLKIFNALGKEVATLFNHKLSASGGIGKYEVEFDGTYLPSGVYFYSLIADGKMLDTKRMMLIK